MGASAAYTVRTVSRRMVRPTYGAMPMPSEEDIQLTPWDLYCLSIKYIQKGILLPRPPAGGEVNLVDTLASSLSRALGRYYHFAGRPAVEEHGDGTVTIPLRPTGEGAELVHAVAPGVAVADLVGSVVQAFLPLNGVCNADAAIDSSLPVLCAQVTELDDGFFIGMSMNHTVGDGACFWDFLNAWSAINRGDEEHMHAPAPVHRRWFVDTSPVPIPVPFSTLQHAARRLEAPPVRLAHGFFTFSAASVKKLKARANDEMLKAGETASISSLQALVAHLWRAVSRARGLPPAQETSCSLLTGCRGRKRVIPAGYVGNAITLSMTGSCTVGETLDKGLGWTAWQLNRAVGSFDEVNVREWLDRWAREPSFSSPASSSRSGGALLITSSQRFDVYGIDFGWGKPVGLCSGPADKTDGKVSVFEGPEREGSISLEVSLLPEAITTGKIIAAVHCTFAAR
ncbi:hypothetical protein ACQ4PT_050564 [Festuca glaucescens]